MTLRPWILAICLAAATAAAPAIAQLPPPAPPAADIGQRQADGLRLAQLLYPLDLQVGMGTNILRNQFGPTLLKDPNV